MTKLTTKPDSMQRATEVAVDLFDNWFNPIETEVRARARQFIEELIRGELDTALARPRYERSKMAGNEAGACVKGHRHGSRTRSLTGTFGPIEIAVPRARLTTSPNARQFQGSGAWIELIVLRQALTRQSRPGGRPRHATPEMLLGISVHFADAGMIGRFHCDEPIADFRWCSGRTNQRGTN